MTFDDFLQQFEECQVAKIHDDYRYTSLKVKAAYDKESFFKVTISQPGKYYFTVHQKGKRHFDHPEDFSYSECWQVMGNAQSGSVNFVATAFEARRETWTEAKYEAGEYVMLVKTSWRDSGSHPFVVSSYGPADSVFTQVDSLGGDIDQALKSKANQLT